MGSPQTATRSGARSSRSWAGCGACVLAGYLLVSRVIGQPEEGRYQHLRRIWAPRENLKFLIFFQFQAFLDVVLSVPLLLPSVNPRSGLLALEIAAVGLFVAAFAGELLADTQLKRFKDDPTNRGRVCDAGLWRYSRHPNYFFEWLIWVAFAVFALPSPYGWIALSGPALILYFLLRVTGIPATEAQAIRSKGDAYRRYQDTTSAFVPWPPRRRPS
jgi:steroid 5-alpha reductase family enzyme